MNKLISKIYQIFLWSYTTLLIAGCGSGAGSGGSAGPLGSAGDALGSLASGSASTSSSLASVHNPEPSSILLLSSGLIGMAVYAKIRLKAKGSSKK